MTIRIEVDTHGFEGKASELIAQAIPAIKQEWNEPIVTIVNQSKNECPFLHGPLVESESEEWEQTETSLQVSIGYNTAYALIQHENMDFHHLGGKKAKYLEDPIKQHVQQLQDATEQGIEKAAKVFI